MKNDGHQASLEHRIADLRAAQPKIDVCHAALDEWQEDGATRYALSLELRWPQHQSLISGPVRDSAEQAVEAGFDQAARTLGPSHA